MDPLQIDDVLEISAYQYVDAGNGSDCDVLGIGPHRCCEHACCNIGFCKLPGLGIELERLNIRLGHGGQSRADLGWGCSEFLHRQIG